jgi:hypothetical protein
MRKLDPRRATGARRWARWSACAACLLLSARAAASVVVEPVARLAVEGGYDSNVRYQGLGGDATGIVSPDVGLVLKDHLWTATAGYGADLITYAELEPGPTVNQRGRLDLDARLTRRTTLGLDAGATYAPDPAGLARLGIFGPSGAALIVRGDARLAWRSTRQLSLAATWFERGARVEGEGGTLLHAPGAEAAWRLGPRAELGVAYRLDLFQSLTSGVASSTAHEARGIGRWRWSRRLTLEAEGGAALWDGGGGSTVVPLAAASLLASGRRGDLRVSLAHGLGLSRLASASLSDSFEVGALVRFGRRFRLRGDGGVWRSGELPSGSDALLGYGVGADFAWLVTRGIEMGIAASRFDQIDGPSAASDRNVVGLRMAWQLANH